MKVYVGQARGSRLIAKLTRFGWGEMTVRGELPPRRNPWAYDNGAFSDWQAGRPFDEGQFNRDIESVSMMDTQPDFIVVPDKVAGGLESLEFSYQWSSRLEGIGQLYLAVQDGMRPRDIQDCVREFDGVFVGGTLEWKKRTAEEWVAWAHRHYRPVHIGRVGTAKRVRWARDIGADSIDSCLPLWSVGNLEVFRGAVECPQRPLFAASRVGGAA